MVAATRHPSIWKTTTHQRCARNRVSKRAESKISPEKSISRKSDEGRRHKNEDGVSPQRVRFANFIRLCLSLISRFVFVFHFFDHFTSMIPLHRPLPIAESLKRSPDAANASASGELFGGVSARPHKDASAITRGRSSDAAVRKWIQEKL